MCSQEGDDTEYGAYLSVANKKEKSHPSDGLAVSPKQLQSIVKRIEVNNSNSQVGVEVTRSDNGDINELEFFSKKDKTRMWSLGFRTKGTGEHSQAYVNSMIISKEAAATIM